MHYFHVNQVDCTADSPNLFLNRHMSDSHWLLCNLTRTCVISLCTPCIHLIIDCFCSQAAASSQTNAGVLRCRLREGIESVVLLSAELSSVQRQLHSSIALQQAAEQRASELEALWHNSSQCTGLSSTHRPSGGSRLCVWVGGVCRVFHLLKLRQ